MIDWTEDRRCKFGDELKELIAKYPEISGSMLQEHNAHLITHESDCECVFDPQSPVFLDAFVLLVSHKNLDNWHDLGIIIPENQSRFVTAGMLVEAQKVW